MLIRLFIVKINVVKSRAFSIKLVRKAYTVELTERTGDWNDGSKRLGKPHFQTVILYLVQCIGTA